MTADYPEPRTRRLIVASVMAATLMTSLDTTIANVALPHIQGSVAASADEISWVLTSYIVAAAIFTPLSGFLAERFGRRRLMLYSIAGFTIASALCGMSGSLGEIVGFRLMQGMFGAALVPMSQAILLDINPPEKHASAMSIWSMGAIVGPIIGPTLGGWLTENANWRWVFFINLPIGLASLAGLFLFLGETKSLERRRFDMFGFGTLALAVGSFQLMLDRGQTQDWFGSTEICIEAALALLFGWLFLVHTLTAARPFVRPQLFADRNYLIGCGFGFVLGVALFSVLALLPPMLERLMGYPVVLTGLVTAPRGISSMVAMMAAGQLMKRIDSRLLVAAGFGLLAWSLYLMSGFSIGMDQREVIVTGFVQGLGTGLIFVPLTMVAFATLPPAFRNEGAAMFTLVRSIGSAFGIAVLQAITVRNAATVHARLVEGIRPDNPVLAVTAPGFDFALPAAVARMNATITAQAAMVSYIDSFRLLCVVSLLMLPLVFLIRRPNNAGDIVVHVE